MKTKLLSLVVASLMLLTFAPAVSATTQGSCPANATVIIRMWENHWTDVGDGNDNVYVICVSGGGRTDLRTLSHTPNGYCNNGTPFHVADDWNDCVDDVTVTLPKKPTAA